jgi:hypothetical protein
MIERKDLGYLRRLFVRSLKQREREREIGRMSEKERKIDSRYYQLLEIRLACLGLQYSIDRGGRALKRLYNFPLLNTCRDDEMGLEQKIQILTL